jgi:predicted phosphodiesterase
MPILIVHLGDLHIRNADDHVLMRGDQVVTAVRSLRVDPSACLVVVPGDVAFSGKADQYRFAHGFFSELLVRLEQEYPGIKPEIAFVAGNHDCDMALASDIRKAGQIHNLLEMIEVGGAFVREYLAVQDAFFEFTATFGQVQEASKDRLLTRRTFVTGRRHTVGVTCYNTAWLSENPESPGKLYFPPALHCATEELTADVEIAVLHHPYNWLQPDSARVFRDALAIRADVILTGHEHQPETYALQRTSGVVEFVAGQAMADARANTNGFNVITIDIAEQRWAVHTMVWNGASYTPSERETLQRPFHRNKALLDQGFNNNAEFSEQLLDMGTGFTHAKKHLRLPDLFVYPSLIHRELQHKLDGTRVTPRRLEGKNVPEFICKERRLMILGESQSGKTSFAKTIYRLLQTECALVPLMVKGDEIRDLGRLSAGLDAAYISQYAPNTLERFKQLAATQRALIVDDFENSPLRRVAMGKVLEELGKWFDSIIIFADTQFELDQVINASARPALFEFRQYYIEEFNRVLRGRLIRKWVTLGRSEDEEDLVFHEIDSREKVLDILLGKQLLPAYPIIILSVLQTLEVSRNINATTGSYGELYEALITERLASISKRPTDLGTKYTIISRLAYFMYDRDIESFTGDDINSVCDRYLRDYQIRLEPTRLLDDLATADIISESRGSYKFKYPYYYHFFVARYFRDNLQDPDLSPKLNQQLIFMADRIYYEAYVNIIVFYLYFTKDTQIIERILGNAGRIYSNYEPASLEDDVEFVNRLSAISPKPMLLPAEDIEKNRDEMRQQLDDIEAAARGAQNSGKVLYADDLDDLIKINIAFKTIHILGQVLRNFPGSLKRDIKVRIAEQCDLLGLRVLGFVLGSVRDNVDELRRYFAILIQHRQPGVSLASLGQSAEEVMTGVVEFWAYGIIKTLSHSVGMEDLAETYKEVVERHGNNLSLQLIDACIKLDHFWSFPEGQIDSLERRVRKNYIGFSVLRYLIMNYLYVFRGYVPDSPKVLPVIQY